MKTGTKEVRIEPIGLDRTGYGEHGTLTRQKWQAKCLQMLRGDAGNFDRWQLDLLNLAHTLLDKRAPPPFEYQINYEDDSKAPIKVGLVVSNVMSYFVLDFAGLTIDDLSTSRVVFRLPVLFAGAVFEGQPHFDNAEFREQVLFQGANFKAGITAFDTVFKEGVRFDYSTFSGLAAFYRTVVPGHASFDNVHFVHDAFFHDAKCAGLSCKGALFEREADFSATIPIDQREQLTIGRTDVSGAHFRGLVNFSNRNFTGALIMQPYEGESTRFEKAPLFHNCKLHQNTTFADCIFAQVDDGEASATLAYNTLRLAMSQKQATHEEQRFLRLELDSERARKRGALKYLYGTYRLVARYGFSLWRPIIILNLLPMLGFLLIYGLFASDPSCRYSFDSICTVDAGRLTRVIELSFLQSLPPLGLDKTSELLRNDLFSHLSPPGQFASIAVTVLQKFLALFGWFFAALALRNQFKMK